MKSIVALIATAAVTASALAAPATPEARAKLREVCRADYERFCANVKRGNGRIKQCMRDNRDRLSEPCRNALDEAAKTPVPATQQ